MHRVACCAPQLSALEKWSEQFAANAAPARRRLTKQQSGCAPSWRMQHPHMGPQQPQQQIQHMCHSGQLPRAYAAAALAATGTEAVSSCSILVHLYAPPAQAGATGYLEKVYKHGVGSGLKMMYLSSTVI